MKNEAATHPYTVVVDDNFHYMDADERYIHGTFATLDEAIAACRRIVDEFLADAIEKSPGAGAEGLYSTYVSFGEDPWIQSTDGGVPFSAWDYAKLRCADLCALESRSE